MRNRYSQQRIIDTHLLRHDRVRRDVLDLLDTSAIALTELVKVLEVFVPQVVVLVLGVEIEVCKRVRQRAVVRHTVGRRIARRWRGARGGADALKRLVLLGRGAVGSDLGGGQLHRGRPLLSACSSTGHGREPRRRRLGRRWCL